ncbi:MULTISPECIES: ImmA/IrrE family metallo-endopeptidase [Micrococcaceae]|uniref:ImmA/IrrE family metallo-endopeptidase n=1 Tax=Micrococcaceae TaxID=1268 RepID=UPI0009EA81D0|nr:ImmA/IrrE family metallo-endopeptidase [Arthrobacter sp. Leaf141]
MTRLSAAQAAGDALNELRLDQSEPIDPFAAIEDAGLELRFRPLEGLLGAVLPGNPGGVLINSARPASLQRYTAAHELGHWYMDQDVLSLDNDDTILGRPHQETREIDAQVFAAHFLMPLELLLPVARRYGMKKGSPSSPEQVYQAARDMHVSYEAAVRQFHSIKFISGPDRARLLSFKPAMIKQRLTGGINPPNSRGDVWIIDNPQDHVEVDAATGDAILLRLIENPATGFRWFDQDMLAETPPAPPRPAPEPFSGKEAFDLERPANRTQVLRPAAAIVPTEVITLIRDEIVAEPYLAGVTPVGGAVTRVVAYAANSPGEESVHLAQVRPNRPEAPASTLELTTKVRGMPEVEFRRRLLEAFRRDEEEANGWNQ